MPQYFCLSQVVSPAAQKNDAKASLKNMYFGLTICCILLLKFKIYKLILLYCNGLQAHQFVQTDVQASVQLADTCKAVDQELQQLADAIRQHRQKCSSSQVCFTMWALLCIRCTHAYKAALLAQLTCVCVAGQKMVEFDVQGRVLASCLNKECRMQTSCHVDPSVSCRQVCKPLQQSWVT